MFWKSAANWRRSLTLRLTLSFALSAVLVLLLLGILLWHAVEQHFIEQDRAILLDKKQRIEQVLRTMPDAINTTQLAAQLQHTVGGQAVMVVIMNAQHQIIFNNSDLQPPAALRQHLSEPDTLQQWYGANQQPWRSLTTQLNGRDERALLAIEISHHAHFMRQFWQTLLAFILLACLILGLAGWLVVTRSLQPLRTIKSKAQAITASRLHTRLPADSIPLELADLADTLNDMLARLETSFQRLSDFSADLAHELRTPVSNLLTQTQVTLGKCRSVDEYQDVLASNAEEFERLNRMITDILFLAKAEHQQLFPQCQPLELSEALNELLEFYEALTEEKQIDLHLQGRGQVIGDRLMLQRAFSNLLSNAIRYTPVRGQIRIHIQPGDPVKLQFSNPGETLNTHQLSRLFDRFYRTDHARSRTSEGTGLGLAITQSIIQAHQGRIDAQSEHGMTTFTIELPAAKHDL